MKKYIAPAVELMNVAANNILVGSLNNEQGNGVQLSREHYSFDDIDDEF